MFDLYYTNCYFSLSVFSSSSFLFSFSVTILSLLVVYFFFFFQAEDGIRDHCVTGVQTCALPILRSVPRRRPPIFLRLFQPAQDDAGGRPERQEAPYRGEAETGPAGHEPPGHRLDRKSVV